MLSKMKSRIVAALQSTLGTAWAARVGALSPPPEGMTPEQAYMAGYEAGFWEGATDAMLIGLDTLQEACETRGETPEIPDVDLRLEASA